MRVILGTWILLLFAGPAFARFNVEVTRAPGFDPSSLSSVVVVIVECHEALDCRRLEREVASELRKSRPDLRVIVGEAVYSELLGLGREEYSPDLREPLATAVGADCLLEISAPHAAPGMAAVKRSEVKLYLRLVRPLGEILFVAEGTGRPKNTLSSPEKAAGEVAERAFAEALRP